MKGDFVKKYKYYYCVDELEEKIEDMFSFSSDLSIKCSSCFEQDVAEDAAEDYYYNCDGWEDTWPLTFFIFDENGKDVGVFDIEKECSPIFCAQKEECGDK